MNDVTLGIFMQRIGPEHPAQLASLEKTRRSFRLEYIFEPGTAHANINKVLDRCTTRYVAICDDDVTWLDEYWLDTLLDVLKEHDQVAMVVPTEIKYEDQKDSYLKNGWNPDCAQPDYDLLECSWLPGYVMLFDRDRVPELRADEQIPGPSGMSDLDLSLQVRGNGFKCILTSRTVVYHPTKPLDHDWRQRWDIVQEEDLPALHHQQVTYMRKKWGSFFDEAIRKQVRSNA